MGIYKLIVIALVLWLAFSLFKKFRKPVEGIEKNTNSNKKMLACSVCKMHIPEDEAIVQNGQIFCSKEHLE